MRNVHRRLIIAILLLALAGWFFNVSVPGAQPEGCLRDCALRLEEWDGSLRLVSLNMLHGYPEFEDLALRLETIAEELNRLGVDLVLLQEVPWTRELGNRATYLARLTGMNYAYGRANGNRWAIFFEEGEAILSRFPLQNPGVVELQPRAGFFEHRVVLYSQAVTPQGRIDLYSTHLTNNQGQAESLLAFVDQTKTGAAIIGGDFNAIEDSAQIKALSRVWVDTYRAAHPVDRGYTCCLDDLKGGAEERFEKRIDYVFLAPDSGSNGWLWPSDHLGILVEIEFGE